MQHTPRTGASVPRRAGSTTSSSDAAASVPEPFIRPSIAAVIDAANEALAGRSGALSIQHTLAARRDKAREALAAARAEAERVGHELAIAGGADAALIAADDAARDKVVAAERNVDRAEKALAAQVAKLPEADNPILAIGGRIERAYRAALADLERLKQARIEAGDLAGALALSKAVAAATGENDPHIIYAIVERSCRPNPYHQAAVATIDADPDSGVADALKPLVETRRQMLEEGRRADAERHQRANAGPVLQAPQPGVSVTTIAFNPAEPPQPMQMIDTAPTAPPSRRAIEYHALRIVREHPRLLAPRAAPVTAGDRSSPWWVEFIDDVEFCYRYVATLSRTGALDRSCYAPVWADRANESVRLPPAVTVAQTPGQPEAHVWGPRPTAASMPGFIVAVLLHGDVDAEIGDPLFCSYFALSVYRGNGRPAASKALLIDDEDAVASTSGSAGAGDASPFA